MILFVLVIIGVICTAGYVVFRVIPEMISDVRDFVAGIIFDIKSHLEH